MASDQNEPATQEILRDTKVMFPMDSRHERDMAHEITVRSSYDDDNAPSQDTSQSDSGEETPYVDVNEAPDWIDEEDGLQTRSDVGEQANGSATAITENDPNEQQQQTPNLALEQGKEKESEKAKDAARQHFVDAVENISLMAMLLDFEHSPRIPTFFQRIVQAYLANLRNDRVILDAACEAAVAFQNYLESSHGLPLTTLSPDEFRNLLASDLQPTQESTSVQTDDPLVATALAPELDTRSTGDRPSAAERMYENEDEMILSNVVNEGPASPIAMSDDSDHKGGRMTTRSMAAASLRRSSIRHDSLPLENQIEEEVQMQEPEGNQCEEDDEQFLMDALLKVRRKRRVKTPEGDDKHAAEATKTRRIYNPWTDDELHALSEGVQRFGPRWIRIKEEYKGVWRNRTNIDLKDKARNVIKQKQREGQDLGHWACCVRH